MAEKGSCLQRTFDSNPTGKYKQDIALMACMLCVHVYRFKCFNSWSKGKITRSQAEDILRRQTADGSFLVRDSESSPGK